MSLFVLNNIVLKVTGFRVILENCHFFYKKWAIFRKLLLINNEVKFSNLCEQKKYKYEQTVLKQV